jgi:ATP-binding cassette subfamily F protein uup
MDEPTNDLDAETLDLLEDLLVEYEGTLLIVSHDRDFLDNVVTSTLVFEGDGRIGDYVGGYADWVRERDKAAARAAGPAAPAQAQAQARADSKAPKGRKLTNKEKQELEALPARIDALESEQAELGAKLADPVFYQRERSAAAAVHVRLDELERQHAVALARWEELEAARTRP